MAQLTQGEGFVVGGAHHVFAQRQCVAITSKGERISRPSHCGILKLSRHYPITQPGQTCIISTTKLLFSVFCARIALRVSSRLRLRQKRSALPPSGTEKLPLVLVTNRVFPETIEMLKAAPARVIVNPRNEQWSAEELRERVGEATAILAFMPDRVDAKFLENCPRLRILACALKGFDNFDVDACTERGVWVTYVPGLLTEASAELAVGLIIGLGRNLLGGDQMIRNGHFQGWRPVLYGHGLYESTVGIYGFGAVGQAIARRLSGFGCKEIKYFDIAAHPQAVLPCTCSSTSFEEVLKCDVVVSAVPLNGSTYHSIDADVIAACMSERTLLANISRGSVVAEAAVAEALHAGKLGGYAADVFEFEDWAIPGKPRDIPDLLLSAPRTLFTPHLGSAVTAVRRAIELSAARAIVQCLQGKAPENALNWPV